MHAAFSRRLPLAFCATLLALAAGLRCQAAPGAGIDGLAPVVDGMPAHGLPGKMPGTERWLVTFKSRSFDLAAFRSAIAAHRPAADVDAIVAGLQASALADQAPFVAAVQRLGARVTAQWWLINAAAVEIAPANLADLRRLPMVAFVHPDVLYAPVILTSTNANNHNADAVQAQGFKGQGVTVGIMDTGQDSDMAGSGRPHRTYFVNGDPTNNTGGGIGGSRLLVNRQLGLQPADDTNGHGTGVASIAAGANWGTAGADDGHAPLAGIAGYAIADQTNSFSSIQTMATAWQTMAADRAALNIVAANLSYQGSPDPLAVDQQAVDSAALNADIMCCVAAANNGVTSPPASTQMSQGAANGLAVAALNANSHTVASFSSRGPLYGNAYRSYPDIAGCGVNTVMAHRDAEASNFVASGTSMASPQVAGAAAQLRARFPALTALETKAILLASTLDISAVNPGLDRNAYGMGMLRNDRAHALAVAGNYGSATLTPAALAQSFPIAVTAGQSYTIAIAWHRQDVTSSIWSDLMLEVIDPTGIVIAQSDSGGNLYERVVVYAPETGSLTVRTTAHYVVGATAQPFSWAWTDAPPTAYRGGALAYGDGCPGTGQGPAVCTGTNTNGGELAGELGPNGLSGGNLYAYDQFTTTPLLVTSFEVFSASNTGGPVTVYAAIHGSVGGFIDLSPLATTTVTIGSAPGFYRATFAAPVAMPVGQFWTTVNHYRTSFVSQLTGGSQTGAFYRGSLGSLWERTTTVRRPAVRVICDSGPGAVPALAISGGYQLGHQVDYQLSLAAPNSAALRALGFSNSTSVFGALPLSLSGLGAPGCSLLTSAESVLFTPTDGAGQASGGLFLPNITGLLGAHVFGQYLVLDATVNPLGIATSNGLNFSIGQ